MSIALCTNSNLKDGRLLWKSSPNENNLARKCGTHETQSRTLFFTAADKWWKGSEINAIPLPCGFTAGGSGKVSSDTAIIIKHNKHAATRNFIDLFVAAVSNIEQEYITCNRNGIP